MAEIVNLRQVRKARDKARKAASAAENRAVFGRSKVDTRLEEKRKTRDAARLEGHRLTDAPE